MVPKEFLYVLPPKLSYLFMGLCFFVIFGAGPVSVIMSGGTVR